MLFRSQNTQVYRGTGIILINNLRDEALARTIVESQIFFREFKSQLHRYLAIHRLVWEKIERIKEQEHIKGTQIDALRNELSDYLKATLITKKALERSPLGANEVNRLVNDHTSGQNDYANELWTLLTLELWYCQYID